MDLNSFLDLERECLTEERERLNERCPEFSRNETDIRGRLTDMALCDAPNNIRKETSNLQEKDDMDQWISDTFYSHFPGFSNEYQNRQLYLQKRQLENQENLIKHQMLNAGQCGKSKFIRHNKYPSKPNVWSADSNNSSITSNGTTILHEKPKPDINTKQDAHISSGDYSLSSVRSGSSRYKLLQDLRHTNLANMINRSNEDEFELNRKQAEIVTARKKQYQQELMQQIEEKRHAIKMLKDKEIQQEKVLTRRLEEQLKTMKLEEKLEKERIKATKIRYDAEQNHLLREHLLSKLENDSKLLQDATRANDINKENITISNDNKVYKYFSNSEKHEYNYRKKSAIPVGIGIAADLVDIPKIERECFHLSEKICPSCDEPLREFDEYCLRCQTKNTLPLKAHPAKESIKTFHENHIAPVDICNEVDDFEYIAAESGRSFHLACIKCERFYKLCSTCLKKSDVCKACQSKRNVCMNCRSTLCSFCLEEIACGKDTETLHVNESERVVKAKADSQNEDCIQVVSVSGESDNIIGNKSAPRSIVPLDSKHLSMNNFNVYEHQPNLSPNIGRDTILNQSNIPSSRSEKIGGDRHYANNPQDTENYVTYFQNDNSKDLEYDEMNIERLRRDTDSKLSRYLRNYSELAFQSRGTQTTSNSTARRDIVICGEHSLSIPLLREMPRMTRKETSNSKKPYSDNIENLKRRWEIPAVQKQSVSRTSPRVITQIGAVRRQLQTDTLFSDDSI